MSLSPDPEIGIESGREERLEEAQPHPTVKRQHCEGGKKGLLRSVSTSASSLPAGSVVPESQGHGCGAIFYSLQ